MSDSKSKTGYGAGGAAATDAPGQDAVAAESVPASAVQLQYADKYMSDLATRNRYLNYSKIAWMVAAIIAGLLSAKSYIDLQAAQFGQQQQEMELQLARTTVTEWKNRAEHAETQLQILQEGFSKLTDSSIEAGDGNLMKSLGDKLNEYESRITQLQSERDHLLQEYKKVKDTLQEIESQFANIHDSSESALQTAEAKQKLIDDLNTKLAFSNDQVAGMRKQLEDSRAGFEALARRYQDTKREQQSLVAQLDIAKTDLEDQKAIVKQKEEHAQLLTNQMSKLKQEYAALQDSLRLMVQPIAPGK